MNEMHTVVADDHVRGPADAPLTVVQYGDYDCPHTRASAAIWKAVEDRLGAPVRFVFRYFPLRRLHPNAQLFSEIAEGAGTLGQFWETHDRLMSHGEDLDRDAVMRDVEDAKVDVRALQELISGGTLEQRIERDVEQGARAGVHSTPTWFFNGVAWDGHYDLETLLGRAELALGR